jgi:hypothetical protein
VAEGFLATNRLLLTEVRASKVARRQNGRPENQRKTTALQPGCRKRTGEALVLQHAAEPSDPLPTLGKKGRQVKKVRCWCPLVGFSSNKQALRQSNHVTLPFLCPCRCEA